MNTDEIRYRFLEFFKQKGHKIIESDSLIPKSDPTLLFTSAGMNQFKDYFLGIKKDIKRATTCQKCFRTGDVEQVGRTSGHHTFFEMLGNFSFGDYFKKDAIAWAWEFLTEELKLPKEKLWISVYKEDDESYDIWHKNIGIPKGKIKKLGADTNFWPANAKEEGPNGPCGPCSEIFCDDVEVWNLVFTQFNRKEGGILEPLPNKNIDTGMGLERLSAVMQGVKSNFEIDIFKPIIKEIEDLTTKSKEAFLIRAIADHIRAVCFLISDGVLPSNEGRGYVERMLIRRAARFGNLLEIKEPFLYKIVPAAAKVMQNSYPEITERRENISRIILAEEERFKNTLIEGERIIDELISSLKKKKEKRISGKDVFRLYDTYGFPVELTKELAHKDGLEIDEQGFKKAMDRQKELSRLGSQMKGDIWKEDALAKLLSSVSKKTDFLGYDACQGKAKILAILKDLNSVEEIGNGDQAQIILDKTPFYAQAGGQTSDTGILEKDGDYFEVKDVKAEDSVFLHIGVCKKGTFRPGDTVLAKVDEKRRLDIMRNHTATHLLQAALRIVLGKHIQQSGSLVAPERLRFDFTHFEKISQQQLKKIEDLVNEFIKKDLEVKKEIMPLDEAKKQGAIALFGEKYSKSVRVVSAGEISMELCGGTHLEKTGQIGIFKIVSESSVGAGLRRIEALTGDAAFEWLKSRQEKEKIDKNAQGQIDMEKLQRQKQIEELISAEKIQKYLSSAKKIGSINFVPLKFDGLDRNQLGIISDAIKRKTNEAIILLASSCDGKALFILSITPDLVKKGISAVRLIKDTAKIFGGSGGGRDDFAQAGLKDASKIDDIFEKITQIIDKITQIEEQK